MPSRKKKYNHFLAVWDMNGLEVLYDVDKAKQEIADWEKQRVWDILKGKDSILRKPDPIPLNMLIIRARSNSQRQYEIYEFNTSDILYDDVKEMFETNPQPLVNWIRNNGHKIYSDYIKQNTKQIV